MLKGGRAQQVAVVLIDELELADLSILKMVTKSFHLSKKRGGGRGKFYIILRRGRKKFRTRGFPHFVTPPPPPYLMFGP